jgi:hypothetical protein
MVSHVRAKALLSTVTKRGSHRIPDRNQQQPAKALLRSPQYYRHPTARGPAERWLIDEIDRGNEK